MSTLDSHTYLLSIQHHFKEVENQKYPLNLVPFSSFHLPEITALKLMPATDNLIQYPPGIDTQLPI